MSKLSDPDAFREGYKPQPDGKEYILAIRVDFSDQPGSKHATAINDALFGTAGSSMRLYFEEVSYGRMQVLPGYLGGVVPAGGQWYRAQKPMSYYGEGTIMSERYEELAEEACVAADADVDFSKYDRDNDGYVDHLMLIHAGNDEASTNTIGDIWSAVIERVDGTYDGVKILTAMIVAEDPGNIAINIGIYCHEFFHEFGAPDLYNWSYPVGHWCLMGTFGPYQDNGQHPSHICGYLKWDFDADPTNGVQGWLKPVDLTSPGIYFVENLELPKGDRLYKIDIPDKRGKEYFLVENRYKLSGAIYDTYLPESGIVIWHIDEKQPKSYGYPNRVWVEDPSDPDRKNYSRMTKGAAYSANDGQTSFTPDTKPNSSANDGSYSGIVISDIGLEGFVMPFTFSFEETYESNDTMTDAYGPLVYGKEYRSFIQNEKDVDYYKFRAGADSDILVYLENIPENCNYDLQVFNPQRVLIATSAEPRQTSEVVSFKTPTAGTYYLKIFSSSGFSTKQQYSLTVDSVQLAPKIIADHNVLPNPGPGSEGSFQFNYKLISDVERIMLDIYTPTGTLVYTKPKTYENRTGKFLWDARTSTGEKVASGIYIYVLKAYMNGETDIKTGKVAVVY